MTDPADAIFLVLLFGVIAVTPVYAWFDQRWLERETDAGNSGALARSLAVGIALQWTAATLLVAAWSFTERTAESVFFVPGWSGGEWIAVAAGLALCALTTGQTLWMRGRSDVLARVREQAGGVLLLAGRTPRERRLLDALSVTAGICEEVVYRGLLLGTLATMIGLWPAVAASAVVFGAAHAYQGLGGALRTGVFGLIVALLTVLSGSIHVAVLLHVVHDLSQIRMLRLAVEDGEAAV